MDPIFENKLFQKLPDPIKDGMRTFYASYEAACKKGNTPIDTCKPFFLLFFTFVLEQLARPFQFGSYHQAIREPFDFYRFGIDFIRPIIDVQNSKLFGEDQLERIKAAIERRENVVLLSNHQSEIDPQAFSILFEKNAPRLASDMIFVAGHRVVTDPLAAPLSKGRNLFCIYSKKYIDNPPEKKAEKLHHNIRTIKVMEEKLQEGGKCIVIFPSGGRDRKDKTGQVQVAPFDPDSIEMLYILAQKSKTPTHFFPVSLSTYDILPPPAEVQQEIGEQRIASFAPAFLCIGHEIDMRGRGESVDIDKKERRRIRAESIHDEVVRNYRKFFT